MYGINIIRKKPKPKTTPNPWDLDAPVPEIVINALVIKAFNNLILSDRIQCPTHLADLELDKPTYDKTARVDLLLGADIYAVILQSRLRVGVPEASITRNISFGWNIFWQSGDNKLISSDKDRKPICLYYTNTESMTDLLWKYLTMDQFPD